MAYSRTAPRTTYRARRARPGVLVAALAVVLVAAVAVVASQLLAGGATGTFGGSGSGGLSAVGRWPSQGQAAVAFGGGRPAASPDQEPAPIASLAKVMTAYLTLERYPLDGADEGFTISVTAAEAGAVEAEADQGQSVVAVRAGERLSERQLLEALLIPSGNNIARMLAARLAGSEERFLAEMNETAAALGMDATTYTDPSGFDPGTVSTAADQLRLFRKAMGSAAFRQIVSTPEVTLPVAGTLTNFDPLLGAGFPGKTGSDSAAGGCLAFFTHVTRKGRPVTAVGVVMGQGQGSDTAALLDAAAEAATRLVGGTTSGGAAGGGVTMRPPRSLPHSAPSP
jgi:serine-type D-Ala-D-Ala carboxypeptidase (penicillin-binding protein 5/6)